MSNIAERRAKAFAMLHERIATLEAEVAAKAKDAERYRTARNINPNEWRILWERNVRELIPFDTLIDALSRKETKT